MASDEVDVQQPNAGKAGIGSQVAGAGRFIYNSDTGAVLGRTAASWGKIGFFYLIFYSCLAAFFAMNMAIFFATVDDNHPKWSGSDSRLGNNPGLGFQPMPDHLSTLIRFKSGAMSTYKIYTDYLHAYLLQYDNDAAQQGDSSNIISCDGGRSNPDKNKVCQFRKESLGRCIAENEFGYNKGEPCVLLKLNKVYGWVPKNDTMVSVVCEGQNPSDKDNMGELVYFPSTGFPAEYFPFLSQQNYMSPLVMVQFKRPELGVLLMIECRALDENIHYNRQLKQGSVRFELLID